MVDLNRVPSRSESKGLRAGSVLGAEDQIQLLFAIQERQRWYEDSLVREVVESSRDVNDFVGLRDWRSREEYTRIAPALLNSPYAVEKRYVDLDRLISGRSEARRPSVSVQLSGGR